MRAIVKIFAVVIFTINTLFARDEKVISSTPLIGASIASPNSYTVDINTAISPYKTKIKQFNSLNGVVTFSINEASTAFYGNQSFTAVADVKIEYWNLFGVKTTLTSVPLTISYNHLNMAANQQLEYNYKLPDAEKITVTVNSLTVNNPTVAAMNIFKLSGFVQTNFTFNLNCTSDVAIGSFNTTAVNNQFSWTTLNVDEVDVEWAYIDKKSKLGADIDLIFPSSSTNLSFSTSNLNLVKDLSFSRLTVDGSKSQVQIPKTYNSGYLIVRTRAAKNNDLDGRVTCDWSYHNSTTSNMYVYRINNDFNPILNWNFNLSFAEGGKWQEALSFYDGMYRERQTVANINTIDGQTVLVGEVFYDVEGRKAGTILPVPTVNNSPLTYYPSFNKNLAGQPYSHLDFNYVRTNYCLNTPGQMSTVSGSSQYYSPDNPDRVITAATNNNNYLFNQFIPDAKKYPLTTIDYTSDQTGKIARQGGVGPIHQVGTTFDTKYFYGKPASQEELDRLFGNDVGYVEHYSKNMVIDPNGQSTISYIDMKGKTIATALAGDVGTHSSIENDNVPTIPIQYDVMTNALLMRDGKSNRITGNGNVIITGAQTATFVVDLKKAYYQDQECKNSTFCADCYYDITIKISDDCGSFNKTKEYKNYSISNNPVSTVCPSNNTSNLADINETFTETLTVGSYTVTVDIRLSEDKIKEYVDAYVANDKCNSSFTEVSNEYMSKLSVDLSCIKNCDDCQAKFSSSSFVTNYVNAMQGMKIDGVVVSNAQLTALAEQIRQSALTECNLSFCTPLNDCSMKRRMMINDLALNGQYGYVRTKTWTPFIQNYPAPNVPANTPFQSRVSTTWIHNNEVVSHNMPWLNSSFCWQSRNNGAFPNNSDPNPWIEVNLGQVKDIKSIKTQGKPEQDAWVEEYELQYSLDGVNYINYTSSGTGSTRKTFYGNSDRNTIVENKVYNDPLLQTEPLKAQYLKIFPKKVKNYVSMRLGVELVQDNFNLSYKDHSSIYSPLNTKNALILQAPYVTQLAQLMGRTPTNINDVLTNWRPEFAEILLPLHPEYCSLKYCEQANDQYQYSKYEAELKNTKTYQEAVNKGYIGNNPGDPNDIFRNDPFEIADPSKFSDYKTNFNFFQSLMSPPNTTNMHTINDWAIVFSKSNTVTDDVAMWNDIAANPLGAAKYCEADKNMQWEMLRNMYLSIREEIFQQRNFCPDLSYIGCAGSSISGDKTLVDLSDMSAGNLCDVWDLSSIDNQTSRLQREFFYKTKHFPKLSVRRERVFSNMSTKTNGFSKTHGSTKSLEIGRVMCKTYRMSWKESLETKCPIFNSQTTALKDKILDDFVELCANSTDGDHPNGASSLTTDKTIGINNNNTSITTKVQVSNFKEILNYRISGTLFPDLACDVFNVIKPQQPYLVQTAVQKSNMISIQVPECNCQQIRKYRKKAEAGGGSISTANFHNYLVANIPDYCLTVDDLQEVETNCEYIAGQPDLIDDGNGNMIPNIKERVCPYLSKQHILPLAFLCNSEQGLTVDCEILGVLKAKYIYDNPSLFPGVSSPILVGINSLPSAVTNSTTSNNLITEEQARILDFFNYFYNLNQPYDFWMQFMIENCEGCFDKNRNIDLDAVNDYIYAYEYKKLYGGAKSNRSLFTDFDLWTNKYKGVNVSAGLSPGSLTHWAVNPLNVFYEVTASHESDFLEDIAVELSNYNANSLNIINQKYQTSYSLADIMAYYYQAGQAELTNGGGGWSYSSINLSILLCLNPLIKSELWSMYFSKYGVLTTNSSTNITNFKNWVNRYIGEYDPAPCAGGTSITFVLTSFTPTLTLTYTQSNYTSSIQMPTFTPPGFLHKCKVKVQFPAIYKCNQVDPPDPCIEAMANMTMTAIQNEYEKRKMNAAERFRAQYIASCMEKADFNMSFNGENNERHYTLYYYDVKGNLIKTIPPAGVRPLTNPSDLAAVKSARDNNTTPLLPEHYMPSEYYFNARNLVYKQNTPDGGTAHFWYDLTNRLIASQNAKQAVNNQYSYTKYDYLGRILESGEVVNTHPLFTNALTAEIHHLDYSDYELLWLPAATDYKFRTRTYYDKSESILSTSVYNRTGVVQENLLQRISHITLDENDMDNDASTYNTALHYSYDVLGNVKSLVSQNTATFIPSSQEFKLIDYNYDLQSGKVNSVTYQKGKDDQFIYKYNYNDNFKLAKTETSYDGLLWETDATYYYYKHGPLARVEYGKNKYQGIDYAYTLQGWLKGINSSTLDPNYDMGQDGLTLSSIPNGQTARDAVAMTLRYYQSGTDLDYEQIGRTGQKIEATLSPAMMGNNLFNGNISSSIVSIMGLTKNSMGYTYRYDQLNRLKAMDAFIPPVSMGNNFSTAAAISDYSEQISYDANGNIMTYNRNKDGGIPMDDLNYKYYYYPAGSPTKVPFDPLTNTLSPGDRLTNQLAQVSDAIGSTVYDKDIDDQVDMDNYVYDEVGNLIEDKQERLTITWTPTGKIKQITNNQTGVLITFAYDPMGNRISKIVQTLGSSSDPEVTYYTRDAQSNTLALYKGTIAPGDGVGTFRWAEQHLYGSSRLGMAMPDKDMINPPSYTPATPFLTGMRQYELTNHLGNVLATVKDEKKLIPNTAGTAIAYYEPIILNATDYYPFGMPMPNRTYSLSSGSKYRFGFNTQEKDDEVYGAGNLYSALFWEYDARIGRRWNIDPKTYTWESPYAVNSNNPIWIMDILGDKGNKSNEAKQKERYEKKWEEKVVTPLKTMEQALRLEGHMSDDQIRHAVQDKADELSVKYQNTKWLQYQYRGASEKKSNESYTSTATGQEHKSVIRINAYSTTTTNVSIDNNRPADRSMVTSGNTRIDAPPGSTVNVQFNPYIQPNSLQVLTGGSRNIVASTGGMIAGPNNPTGFTFNQTVVLSTTNAGNIYYRVQNSNISNTSDTWQLRISVTTPLTLNPKVTAENPQYEAYKLFGR